MSVANSRGDREKRVGELATMSRHALLQELVAHTVTAHEIAEESREVRRRRADTRVTLELIAAELKNRVDGAEQAHPRPEVVSA